MRGPSIHVGGPLLFLFFFGLVGLIGLGFFLASTGGLRALAPQLYAAGGDLPMPAEPATRNGQTPDADPELSEMPALVKTDSTGGAPDTWPDLGPAALIQQAAAIPDRALTDTAFDLPPWRRYARPFTDAADAPRIAILVTGNGIDRAVTAAAIAGLPAEVSLSFNPYAPDLADWIAAARAFGHEALIDLPLQGKDFPAHDPGPMGLLIGLNPEETIRRLDAIADSGNRSIGFAGVDGGALLLDDDATNAMLTEINRLGRAFVETGGEPMSRAAADAATVGLPFGRARVRLDEVMSAGAIATRLAIAAQLAQQSKTALAVTQSTPLSITAIAGWARQQGQTARLAPVSALLNQ
jgi:polysaccharide deacetylase 2 family uncharacterized protein YibQ